MLFPKAKFIHILRNPRNPRNPNDVARSHMNFFQAGNAGLDFTKSEAYATWTKLTTFEVKGERGFGLDRLIRTMYEDLLNYPQKTLKQC